LNPKLYFRLNITNEKNILRQTKELYDGLVIGAHFASFYKNWISGFLQDISKPYFIDPLTYIFAIDPPPIENIDSIMNEKQSFRTLCESYPEILRSILEERPLIPQDFLIENNPNTKLINEFLKSQFKFQEEVDGISPAQKRISEYFEFESLKEEKTTVKTKDVCELEFYTIPYFHFQSLEDPWYYITKTIHSESIKFKKDKPIYSILCFNKEILLDEKNINTLFEDFKNHEGVIFWVHNFNSKTDSKAVIKSVFKLYEKFNKNQIKTIDLYGDYFSTLILNKGLDGYCRSLGFGEYKQVRTISIGGGAPNRYYLPEIHANLPEAKIRYYYSKYTHRTCNCKCCRDIISQHKLKMDSVDDISKFFDVFNFSLSSKLHFVYTHSQEMKRIINLSNEEIIDALIKENEIANELEIPFLLGEDLSFYDRWINILREK